MATFNQSILVGNLTRTPELKQTTSGKSVTSFTLAVNRVGEGVDYFDITAWGKTAELAAKYLKKGSCALVCGRLQFKTWEDKQGNKRKDLELIAEEILFLSSSDSVSKPAGVPNPTDWGHGIPTENFEPLESDEDLPF